MQLLFQMLLSLAFMTTISRCTHPTTVPAPESGKTIFTSTEHSGPDGTSPDDALVLYKNLEEASSTQQTSSTSSYNELENRVLDSISIKLSDEFLPEDYFAEKRATVIWLYGHYPFPYTILKVDVNAFRSTKNHTKKFEFVFIDFKELNLGFLSEFNQLTNLKFSHSVNIEHCLPTLPLMLPSLTSLSFSACEGLSRLHNFPTLFRGLDEMVLSYYENYELNDETTSQIFDWLLLSSANTLKHLTLQGIGPHLTRVPRQISNFTNLDHFFLTNNNISTIKSGDLSFSVPVMHLYLDNNGIKLIEPGAFKGDFKHVKMILDKNNLTQLDESVFGPLVQQMESGIGSIKVFHNPIDCSIDWNDSFCHLTWSNTGSNKAQYRQYPSLSCTRFRIEGQCSNAGKHFFCFEFKHC